MVCILHFGIVVLYCNFGLLILGLAVSVTVVLDGMVGLLRVGVGVC